MNAPFDKLRAGLAELAEEVEPVDLLPRTLATSRRLRLQRALAGSAAVVATIAAASGVALATQQSPAPPPPVATQPAPSAIATPQPSRSALASPPPSPVGSAPAGSTPGASGPTTSPTATSVKIPRSAMLQPRDAGSGFTVGDDLGPGDHGSLFLLLSYCGYASPTWTAKDDHVLARAARGLNAGDERYVLQEATRFEAGWGARVMTELRTALRSSCRTVSIGGNPDDTSALTVVASGFAGDGSLLVKDVRSAPDGTTGTQYHVAVRQGDVYAHARIHLDGVTQAAALQIGRRAAQRLCAATPTC